MAISGNGFGLIEPQSIGYKFLADALSTDTSARIVRTVHLRGAHGSRRVNGHGRGESGSCADCVRLAIGLAAGPVVVLALAIHEEKRSPAPCWLPGCAGVGSTPGGVNVSGGELVLDRVVVVFLDLGVCLDLGGVILDGTGAAACSVTLGSGTGADAGKDCFGGVVHVDDGGGDGLDHLRIISLVVTVHGVDGLD